jgi:1-acyl-sn-glycerol-3-phosphate acyltransferase
MSDSSYRWGRRICYPAFWICSCPLIVHAERAALAGGYILAPNHLSPLDTPVLVGYTPRQIDFLGVEDVRNNRLMARFYALFNIFYVDRNRRDTRAALTAVRRLQLGRVVGIFPEGGIRDQAHSVLNGGPMKPGVAAIAQIADVPVIPCVVLGAAKLHRVRNWLPRSRTRYGVIFGQPLRPRRDLDKTEARRVLLDELRQAYPELGRELMRELGWSNFEGSP